MTKTAIRRKLILFTLLLVLSVPDDALVRQTLRTLHLYQGACRLPNDY